MKDITHNLVDYLITLHDRGLDRDQVWRTIKHRFNIKKNDLSPKGFRQGFLSKTLLSLAQNEIRLVQIGEISVFMDTENFDKIAWAIKEKEIPSIELLYTWDELSIFIPELHKPKVQVISL